MFDCDPVSQGETPYSGSGALNFSTGLRERLRALGLDLALLPWGEYQRRHCHNKSYFPCRCCEVNPAICCVSRQRSVGVFFLAGKEQFSAGIALSNIHSQLYLPICLAEDSLTSPGGETAATSALRHQWALGRDRGASSASAVAWRQVWAGGASLASPQHRPHAVLQRCWC